MLPISEPHRPPDCNSRDHGTALPGKRLPQRQQTPLRCHWTAWRLGALAATLAFHCFVFKVAPCQFRRQDLPRTTPTRRARGEEGIRRGWRGGGGRGRGGRQLVRANHGHFANVDLVVASGTDGLAFQGCGQGLHCRMAKLDVLVDQEAAPHREAGGHQVAQLLPESRRRSSIRTPAAARLVRTTCAEALAR